MRPVVRDASVLAKEQEEGEIMEWPWTRLWQMLTRRQSGRGARDLFLRQRPQLQKAYFAAAAASGKPRGLRWKACEWEPAVEFARERATGSLTALAGVVLEFEAVEGGDMEGVAAVGNLRNASAVFFFHDGQWRTTGKTVFNLNPDEALVRFQSQYERLSEDSR
jgi:hypothetical protein